MAKSYIIKGIRSVLRLYLKWVSPSVRKFYRSFDNVEKSQQQTLKSILRHMHSCDYGMAIGLSTDMSHEDFAAVAPVVTYESLREYLDGRAWDEPIRFFEWTSGTSSPRKKIPYTPSLRKSFESMFEVWLFDLLTHLPELRSGQCYFSISPVSFESESEIKSDFDYTSGFIKWALAAFSVVPQSVKGLRDPQRFREVTALYLLASAELEIVSVWSPSFLLSLLDFIRQNRAPLMEGLKKGVLDTEIGSLILPHSSRSQALKLVDSRFEWSDLWPHLKFISCWGHGSSATGYAELQRRFPNILFQAKGLLATEAPLTIPFLGTDWHLPILNEVYYELMDEQGVVRPLVQGRNGEDYELVISQKSGLLRYRLGDRIRLKRCGGRVGLEFLCRTQVSDLVGEKLHEAFVAQTIQKTGLAFGNYILVPSVAFHRYYFVCESVPSECALQRLDLALRANPHYDLARNFEQLQSVEWVFCEGLLALYEEFYQSKGVKLGDIKWNCLFYPVLEGDAFLKMINAASKKQSITDVTVRSKEHLSSMRL